MIELDAPAKVNLSLSVGPVRADGFHPVDSVVQTVSVVDTLRIEPADEDRLTVTGPDAAAHSARARVSSRIQMPRPCVPMTRSSSLTTMSRTGTTGKFDAHLRHELPSSKERYSPVSVPA